MVTIVPSDHASAMPPRRRRGTIAGMAQTLWRDPQVEEAPRNLILQNRCGNRLSLLFHERETVLDLSYKPNAFRRPDLAARTFSGRDLWTNLFADARIPDLGHGDVAHWGYDPFATELRTQHAGGARNRIRIWNLPHENAFVLCARAPLALVLRPHRAFADPRDGLFIERFHDRGEDIVSFVAHPSRQLSRLRDLADGARAIQLLEDDLVVIGGEENPAQVERLLAGLAGLTPDRLDALVAEELRQPLAAGRIETDDAGLQRVLDLNRRIVWSGLDAGGACFGALNRIYHLVWTRDGAMTGAHMAQAGNPSFLRVWAPFLLRNPSPVMAEDGSRREEFGQLVGSRWSKAEDDGLFYATWSLFAHWQATGDDALVQGAALPRLAAIIDRHLESRFDPDLGLMGSDTLGEESLHGSPYFGYDVVNGRLAPIHGHGDGRTPIRRAHSLYQQANTVNVLLMAAVLLAERPEIDGGRRARWLELAAALTARTRALLARPDGTLAAMILVFADGSREITPFGPRCDLWETAWAVSQGPFLPWPDLQAATARLIRDAWPPLGRYGISPWNCVARALHARGLLPAGGWRAMLADELREAALLTTKYPMPGALTESVGWPEGWRGLPFSAGSLAASACAQLLRAQAQGVAVAGGAGVRAVRGWRWRLSTIDAEAGGDGDGVASWSLDGERFVRCLQVPEDRLRAGRHAIAIARGTAPALPRLIDGDGRLLSCREDAAAAETLWASAAPLRLTVAHAGAMHGAEADAIPGTALRVLRLPAGRWSVRLDDAGTTVRPLA